MPLGPAPTPPPAAPVNAPGTGSPGSGGHGGLGGPGTPAAGGPGVHAASATGVPGAAGEVAPGPVPVTSARAERDAIAAATAAGTLQRKRNGVGDVVATARRIAAALNAPDMATEIMTASKFFWMTAVTTDGAIVVANSYGLAYVPDTVSLPEPVRLATADDSVPAVERAQWATYPVMALQRWAAHHGTQLRAVIATAAQFAGTDPGVAKVVLEPDDIPSSGRMTGRNRLEVAAPQIAARLAATGDLALLELVPPALADAEPPIDSLPKLWFEAFKPLTHDSPTRSEKHLQAFSKYTVNARDLALHAAQTAIHAQAQRAAVADWLYWDYLTELLADALAESVLPS